jgi:hypothetical protein
LDGQDVGFFVGFAVGSELHHLASWDFTMFDSTEAEAVVDVQITASISGKMMAFIVSRYLELTLRVKYSQYLVVWLMRN